MLSLIKLQKTIKEREHTANILYHKRFDISTEQFDRIKHLLPQAKNTGRPLLDNYLTLNAIFGIMRSGAPWRDLPPDYGNWNSIYHKTVLADRAYGSEDIRTYLAQNEVKSCIPDKKNAQIYHLFEVERVI